MNRSRIREHVFKLIFSYGFDLDKALDEHVSDYLMDIKTNSDEVDYITNRVKNVIDRRVEIDEQLNKASFKWPVSRMANVDAAILRLMVYEVQYDDDIPSAVAINEGIELAKKFGGEQSPKFVNGVIAGIIS